MRALYVRTSTTDQDGAAQLHALKRAADVGGWLDVREFTDIGHSGAKASRPALDGLKKAACAG
jgi:DNA invertase Pin-like site-specific DNA recombinase